MKFWLELKIFGILNFYGMFFDQRFSSSMWPTYQSEDIENQFINLRELQDWAPFLLKVFTHLINIHMKELNLWNVSSLSRELESLLKLISFTRAGQLQDFRNRPPLPLRIRKKEVYLSTKIQLEIPDGLARN